MNQALPLRALALLGDEESNGIDPSFVESVWSNSISPSLMNLGFSVAEERDSQYPDHTYYLSHESIAARMNSVTEWPSLVYGWGVTSTFYYTTGYLLHTHEASYPWDGSLLIPGRDHHYVFIGPGCGMGDVFWYTQYRPSLLEMLMFQQGNNQWPLDNIPSCVAAISNTRGGAAPQHKDQAELINYFLPRTSNTFEAYKKALEAYALLYPGYYHYAMGMIHLGLPMLLPRDPASVESIVHHGELARLELTNPFVGNSTIRYSLPALPQGTRAELLIVSVDGRIVDRLPITKVEGSLEWRAANVASGVYFVNLVVNNHQMASRKITLLK